MITMITMITRILSLGSRLHRWHPAGLVLLCGTLGCATRVAPRPTPLSPATPSAPAAPAWVAAPHRASIVEVALDSAGEAALTVDDDGQARFWPWLDERAIPLEVPVRGADAIDLLRANGGWQLLTSGGGSITTFWASHDEPRPRRIASVPGHSGVFMAGGSFVVLEGQRLVTYDRQGQMLGTDALNGPLEVLLTPADRSAVVVIAGSWHDSLELGWEQGTSYADVLGRFDGSATRYVRSDAGAFASSGSIELHSLEEPSPSTFTVTPGGAALGYISSTPPEEEGSFLVEQIDFERGATSQFEEGSEPEWWACSDAGHNDWTESECPEDPRPEAANAPRAKWAKHTVVIPWSRWLQVVDRETRRALGSSSFVPQSATWSPDGERLAFAVNAGDDQSPTGRVFITDGPLDRSSTPSLKLANLDSSMGIAELVWDEPEILLIVGLEAQLAAFDMTDATPVAIQELGEPPGAEGIHHIEHNRAAGLTLIQHDGYEASSTIVSWSKDDLVAGPLTFADGVTILQLGLQDGEERGVWMLGPQGLATASLAELRSGPITPRFTPLSADPRAVFDVSWDRDGTQIIDWGDRWEVSVHGRKSEWLRDVLAFGPLLRADDGSKLVGLPDCEDEVAAVHPAPAAALGPGDSWTLPVAKHTKIRWSPDGSKLVVIGDPDPRYPAARIIDVQTHDIVAELRDLPYEIVRLTDDDSPPQPRSITGRCRSNDDLHQELFPGDA